MAPPRPRGPTQRLLALPATRRLVLACAVLGALSWVLILAHWTLVAAFVAAVFLRDAAPGDVNGQGLNDKWYVVDPAGNAIGAP